MIKCVVFDFDGTLVDSNTIKRQTFFEIVQAWDPSGATVAEVLDRWPAANRYEKTRRIAESLISRNLLSSDSTLDEWSMLLANDYTETCESAIASCPAMPGADQVLAELTSMELCLFVNSATPVKPLQRLLSLRKWDDVFLEVYGAESGKADNLQSIAKKTGAKADEIVHVGDQLDDQLGAETFGCHFVAMLVNRAVSSITDTSLIIKDLRDLPPLLRRISGEPT
ncbi:MAG: HAD family hydrolase [Deltaproteobacteria bacterium]|jgi:phosphoglycolate phosphatase-like HAD superfamily hydrolase|nr:HAD family hydrolase [Deltaproteobacteria bacterium]